MSTIAVNAALTAASAANSATAQQAARQAHRDSCVVFESRFDVAQATPSEKQEYAACIEILYPAPTRHGDTLLLKAGVIVILVCIVLGALQGWREEGDIIAVGMYALMGGCMAVIAIMGLVLCWNGITFLFS